MASVLDDGATLSRCRSAHLVWLDTTDSSGTTCFEVLPYVDLYAKNQLLKDRTRYTASLLRDAVLHGLSIISASGIVDSARGVAGPGASGGPAAQTRRCRGTSACGSYVRRTRELHVSPGPPPALLAVSSLHVEPHRA